MVTLRVRSASALIGLLLTVVPAVAQEHTEVKAEETKAQVPALTRFHTTIYKIWHTAWPKKDTEMLAALVPDIEKGVAEVAAAELPGILRDKKQMWTTHVKKLQDVATAYKAAIDSKDQQKMLDAGEALHAQYEAMIRLIRPVLKEIEAFHEVLYMLYHYYLPGEDLAKIKSSAEQLKEKMAALDAATLPERMKKREAAFVKARAALSLAVNEVAGVAVTDDMAAIKKAVDAMHSKYETLEKVFE
jgi:hypothetical protein